MSSSYNASAIEVLTGLEPVRKRPGMYTDTTRPNHLAQEVVDNSVDEAIAGYARTIDVTLYTDGSLAVSDDGRGMPVDIHPGEKLSGVEVILTRLHAGGKFSHKNYRFSGGLHGVGVSVVNALSSHLEIWIRRNGKEYNMAYVDGERIAPLEVVGNVARSSSGTTLRFWPDAQFFDSPRFSVPKLQHILRAKAVLCPGLTTRFVDQNTGEHSEWCYRQGLGEYLTTIVNGAVMVPDTPFTGAMEGHDEAVDWAVAWLTETTELCAESYVNLIPTSQGGTHVNGFRAGLTEAIREFCEFRNLLPRGVRITPEDVWDHCNYVLSVKVRDPQFSGQTKERLSSRECAKFVSGVIKDAFSLWLNQQPDIGEQIAELAVHNAQLRQRKGRQVVRKKVTSGPALPGKLSDCTAQDLARTELFLVEGDSAGGSAKQARNREYQAVMPLRGKILNTWELDAGTILASQEVHDISVAVGVDPESEDLSGLRYGKICILADADSDGAHIATLLCALFTRHFRPLVLAGHIFVAMPPLYRIDVRQKVFYSLDDAEKQGILDRLTAEGVKAKINVQRFKGLGEMNPLQLRETTMDPPTRRLVQLTLEPGDDTCQVLDLLLAKGRASDRKAWLQKHGDRAQLG